MAGARSRAESRSRSAIAVVGALVVGVVLLVAFRWHAAPRTKLSSKDRILKALRQRQKLKQPQSQQPRTTSPNTSALLDPDAAEDDLFGSDDELRLIAKIVKVAEAKAEKEKERKRAAMLQTELSRRAVRSGSAAAAASTSAAKWLHDASKTGGLVQDITGHKCSAPTDCTEACQRGCEREAVQRACEKECDEECADTAQASAGTGPCPRAGKSKQSKAASTTCKAAAAAGGGAHGCAAACQSKCAARRKEELTAAEKTCLAASRGECQAQCSTGGSYASALSHAAGDFGEVYDATQCEKLCEAEFVSRCRTAQGGVCASKCGKHVCTNGLCACPIFYSGDTQCGSQMRLAEMLPPRYQHCVVPFTDDRFRKGSAGNKTIMDSDNPANSAIAHKFARSRVLNSGRAPSMFPDLAEMADWSTCAVVGSSSSMSSAGLGAEVDNHTAVIRFNDAPTEEYESDVGSKTTLRVQNVMYCGFHEKRREVCLHYTGWRSNRCSIENRRRWPTCNYAHMSFRMLRYVRDYLAPAQTASTIIKKDTSAGFFGVLLALHMCGSIDIYGFTQSSRHYFHKVTKSKSSFGEKHSWRLERQCLAVISSLPQVQRRR